jgi:DNA-binding beta-propeller fold protein YncE
MNRSTRTVVALVIAAGALGCGGAAGTTTTGAGGGGGGATGNGGNGGNGGSSGNGGAGGLTGTGGSTSVPIPGAFGLTSPKHGSSAQPLGPTLQWDAADNAASYTVEVATSPTFGSTDVGSQSVDAPTTTVTLPANTLTPGIIYYWRVTAVNATGSTVATDAPRWFSSPYQVPGAYGIAVTPNGGALVVASNVNNGPIDIITLADHAVSSVTTGVASQPMGIAISPDGAEALATLLTNGNGGVNGVAVLDLQTGAVTRTVADPCVATTLSDVAYAPDGSWAAIPDLSGGCTAMGLSTFSPDGASPGFDFVNFQDTNDPLGVAISPDGTTALVTMELDNKVYKVTFPSTVTHVVLPSTSATSTGVAITPDGTKGVIAENTVDVIDLATGGITPIPMTGDSPNGDFHNLALTPDGARAVVVGAQTVQVLSLASATVLASYPAVGGTNVAVSPDGTTAFVSDRADGWVRVILLP